MRLRFALIALAAVSCSSPAAEIADAAIDAVADAVMDTVSPTKDAHAEDAAPPAPTTIDEVVCDKQYSGVVGVFAEKAYPGRSAPDLARILVLDCNAKAVPVPGMCGSYPPMVTDGKVIAHCGTTLDGRKVRLIVPPPL